MFSSQFPAIISFAIAFFFLIISFVAILRKRSGKFFKDSLFLSTFGIYVWGDALIVAPFWVILALLTLGLGLSNREFFVISLIFFLIRSLIEIQYWLYQQFQKEPFNPPFFRKWFKPLESAILLQVWHTIIVVFSLVGILKLLNFL